MIRSQWDKFKQGLNIGFIQADNRLVVDIEECKISEPAINEQIRQVRANPPPKGGIKVTLRIAPEDWEVPVHSFFQNNFFLLPKLVETVRDRVAQSGVRFLVDAYCGVGFFGIEVADLLEWFVGSNWMRTPSRRHGGTPRSAGSKTASLSWGPPRISCRIF
jgi:tRNA/tmRNA/rRNA uracil-C5-methylase (TrmA/RlmC/RlmD family)